MAQPYPSIGAIKLQPAAFRWGKNDRHKKTPQLRGKHRRLVHCIGGQLRFSGLTCRSIKYYSQAEHSGSSKEHAFGTGAGASGDTDGSLGFTALRVPVVVVDFSVDVAASARR